MLIASSQLALEAAAKSSRTVHSYTDPVRAFCRFLVDQGMLGQGMLAVGWNPHTLTAPGKFLVSAPEHTTAPLCRGLPRHR